MNSSDRERCNQSLQITPRLFSTIRIATLAAFLSSCWAMCQLTVTAGAAEQGNCPTRTFHHEYPVNGCSLDDEGSRLLTWGADIQALIGASAGPPDNNDVRLWDVEKGRLVRSLSHGDQLGASNAQFTSNANRILTAAHFRKRVRLWDVAQNEPVREFKSNFVRDAPLFSKDRSHFLVAEGKTLQWWDVSGKRPLQQFDHEEIVRSVRFTRDESHILSVAGNKAYLWNMMRQEPLHVFEHAEAVTTADFNRDETKVVATSGQQAILWDVLRGKPVRRFEHNDTVAMGVLSADEETLVTRTHRENYTNHKLCVWQKKQGRLLGTIPMSFLSPLVFSPDNSLVFILSDRNVFQLWDANRLHLLGTLPPDYRLRGARFRADGSQLVTWIHLAEPGKGISLWNVRPWERVWQFGPHGTNGVAFNGDHTRVLAWSSNGNVELWDVKSDLPQHRFKHDASVTGAMYTADESGILTWGEDGAAKLWDIGVEE